MVNARFLTALMGLVLSSKDIEIVFINNMSSRITVNRNEIVKFAIKEKCTHLLFIDSDMTFPPNALEALLEVDKDVVCATATRREEGGTPLGIPLDEKDYYTTKSLIKMAMVGMPFMLLKMSVFEKMTAPYFAEPIMDGNVIPEDNYFCLKIHEAGFDIWCHLNLSLAMGHVGYKEYKINSKPIGGLSGLGTGGIDGGRMAA